MNLDRTLIIAPHPDDDVIAAGGLIQHVVGAGGMLHIVFVTDGENNPWPQRWMHKKWSITAEDRAAWGAMRREEAHCSLTRLGADSGRASTTFLALPDQKITSLLRRGDLRLLHSLRTIISEFRPTLMVTPTSRDLHADHRATAWSVHMAAADVPIVTYIVHGSGREDRLACRIELSEMERRRKHAAIECHRSQLLLSRDRFLAHARSMESFYAAEFDLIGVESKGRERLASLGHAIRVMLGGYPPPRESGVKPAADVQDRSSDVAGLF